MLARIFCTTLAAALILTCVVAQESDIQRGKVVKIDVDNKSITLQSGGKEQTLRLTESSRVLNNDAKSLAERFQGVKAGADVMFKSGKRGDVDYLVGLRLLDGAEAKNSQAKKEQPRERVTKDTSDLIALTELGAGKYKGFEGGLYPGGKNERPKEHEAAGLRLAKEIVPRDAEGKPSPEGKIVLLSVGMSNTNQASSGFQKAIQSARAELNPRMIFVNGAVGGMTAAAIQNPDSGSGAKYWAEVDQRLKQAGVTRAQVQSVWIKEADAGPNEGFPAYAKKLQAELTKIVQLLPERFPNVKTAYLSGRTYGGYATSKLNPEPYAYESGFSVKWLIEEQLKGDASLNYDPARGKVMAPWLSWGPYLWANGAKKNPDGLYYEASDFLGDGTHHAQGGIEKLGQQLLTFFRTDSTTRGWFARP